ncbi:MAG: amino acid permease [Francisellaceae bacterium]
MKKSIGGAFMVIGTTIGAGMLSLPLITAASGLMMAVILMVVSWSVMYFTSLKLLKICSDYPLGVNMTTLIKKKMPGIFQAVFIICYLLLLYALMSAYTTQGASLVQLVGGNSYSSFSSTALDAVVFLLIFGVIVLSTRLSDYINRSFVSIKLVFFVLCVLAMIAYLHLAHMLAMPISIYALLYAWPTLLPSFGFQNIVPVLYEYQKGDIKAIKRSILIGSLSVLVIYIIWIIICLGILPQSGSFSYASIFSHGNTLGEFIDMIKHATGSKLINTFLSVFINISILTSFICVGLSLYHYIKDTFKRFNVHIGTVPGFILTFLPPFAFTVFYPQGFILALQYAAIFAVIIFVFTPLYLDRETRMKPINLYPFILGLLVIIAQILNLSGFSQPF